MNSLSFDDVMDKMSETFEDVYRHAENTETKQLYNIHGSAISVLLYRIWQRYPILYIADDYDEAGYIYSDICNISDEDNVLFFPSSYKRSIKYGNIDDINIVCRNNTIKILTKHLKDKSKPPIIITYPEAIAENVSSEEVLSQSIINIKIKETIDYDYIISKLIDWDYIRVDYVYEAGQFAIRGSIIDIFTYCNESPYRIDLFGDEVESIRIFEIENQLSIENLTEISIMPDVSKLIGDSSLFSLMPSFTQIFSRDNEFWKEKIKSIYNDIPINIDDNNESDNVFRFRQYLCNPIDIIAQSNDFSQWVLSNTVSSIKKIAFDTEPQKSYNRNFDYLSDDVKKLIDKGYTLLISTKDTEQYERICSILKERGVIVDKINMLSSLLHAGFIDNKSKIAIFTEHQLFDRYHKYNLSSDKIRSGKITLTLKELNSFNVGDYIVHSDHGIGKFDGLITIDNGSNKQEAVKIIYNKGDSIYVSIHSLHKLSHYKSKDTVTDVQLSNLGSGAWQKLKDRTKTKVKDIARDLIKLYKQRINSDGFAFSPDCYIQKEMEAGFVFEPTPDQYKACEEIKRDMEKPYPMDRLLVGDVGFGKTEVAIRAAFKAIQDGKQVAVLVPTTLLAWQHYNNFTKRLKDMPANIEYISRGRTNKEIKEILQRLKDGNIDIIIGTHRLTSNDVSFKSLGLLIIDEEQKFGVSTKEKLRKLQINVDTLTMSATPIPRTLQFSLIGARDFSNIMTPPPNRYPIETVITRFNAQNIKDAIEFEVSRNGQVFFVHNKVHNIEQISSYISDIVPDIRVCFAHGQMPSKQMEDITTRFALKEFDVLVATTIIENGIDIPNANTIIINDAHHYGLSELHQLRGRVGRGNKKAFCFMLTPPLHSISTEAKNRIQAIENFSDLGSGIKIALQDLDQRGAGNALGAEQSGFIASLGYETYQKVFEEAVKELKEDEFSDIYNSIDVKKGYVNETVFETDINLAISEAYVPTDKERILLYRELDNLKTEKDIDEFKEKLVDRFGKLPRNVEELILVPHLRYLASNIGIEKIILKNHIMSLHLVSDLNSPFFESNEFNNIMSYVYSNGNRCKVLQKNNKNIIRINNVRSISDAMVILHTMSDKS